MMVTHDAVAASYADRILFIKDGKLFNELRRGDSSRTDFYQRILEVQAFLSGKQGASSAVGFAPSHAAALAQLGGGRHVDETCLAQRAPQRARLCCIFRYPDFGRGGVLRLQRYRGLARALRGAGRRRKHVPRVGCEHFRHPLASHDLFQRRRRCGFGLFGSVRQPVRCSGAQKGVRHIPAAGHEPSSGFLGGADGNADRRRSCAGGGPGTGLSNLAGHRLRHGGPHRRGHQRLPSAVQHPLRRADPGMLRAHLRRGRPVQRRADFALQACHAAFWPTPATSACPCATPSSASSCSCFRA